MNKSFPCKVFFNKENSNVFRLPEPFSHIWSFWFNLQWAWKNYKKKHKLRPDFLFDWISPILFKFIFITLNVCFPDCKLSYLSHASKIIIRWIEKLIIYIKYNWKHIIDSFPLWIIAFWTKIVFTQLQQPSNITTTLKL